MMKRLVIVCEGQTEQSFCQNVLSPYFQTKGIVVEAPTIKHSHGGIVPSNQGFLSVPWVGRGKNYCGFSG